MFGLGIGELLLIVFVIFLISPKEIPKVMKKIGDFFASLNSIKDEIMDINEDVKDIINDTKIKDNYKEITKENRKSNVNSKKNTKNKKT